MTPLTHDQLILERYTDQPARLPDDLRAQLETALGGEVRLYALADLDAELRLAETWVALGDTRVATAERHRVATTADGAAPWRLRAFPRQQISAVRETSGLSNGILTLDGGAGSPPLAVLRYTQRQRRAMENLRFVLDEALGGRAVPTGNADAMYMGGVAGAVREAQALVAGRQTAVLRRLLGYLGPYRREVTLGMAAATVITAVSLVPPRLAGYLIDRVVRPVQEGVLRLEHAVRVAWLAVAAMAAVYLVRQAAAVVRLRLMSVIGEWVTRDLRRELYTHLQRLSLSFFSRKKTGGLITRVTSDTDRLWEFLAFGIVDVSLSLVMLVGLSAVLLTLDWRLGLVMTLPVPVFCWLIFRHGEGMEPMFLRAWRKWSRMTDVLSDTIPGMRVVKAFNQERRETERFSTRNVDVTDEINRIHHVWTTFWPALVLLVHLTTLGVWVFAVPRLLGVDAPALSAGAFVSFLLYATMFVAPIEVIGQMARIMNRATTSAHRVFEVLDTEPELTDDPHPVRLEPVRGRVAFDNVTFGYDGVRQVVRGMSFEVAPGEVIGLVGPSGGGKTTVINLLARFYDVTGGHVLVDGVDIRRLDSGHYRRQVGIVLQDPYLFHGTVVENIRYGHPEATLAQVIAAARAANAHDFVCKLAHGYDTVVGERGHTLSGGERQRVSIARAILHDPRILILDEATSSVDTETEYEIQEALDRLIRGRTVFAIAHRLSTLRRADRLFVIEDGRIVEAGTHEQLLTLPSGIYRRLYTLQRELA